MPVNAVVLTDLLIRERSALLRFLSRYLERSACEDAYQSMYFKLSSVPGHPPIEDKLAYLYRVAYHQAVDRVRSQRRERNALEEARMLLDGEPMEDGSRSLPAKVELQQLTAIILSLPEPTQRIFLLNRYHGMPEREIAALLGVSKSLISKHIRRALKFIEERQGA